MSVWTQKCDITNMLLHTQVYAAVRFLKTKKIRKKKTDREYASSGCFEPFSQFTQVSNVFALCFFNLKSKRKTHEERNLFSFTAWDNYCYRHSIAQNITLKRINKSRQPKTCVLTNDLYARRLCCLLMKSKIDPRIQRFSICYPILCTTKKKNTKKILGCIDSQRTSTRVELIAILNIFNIAVWFQLRNFKHDAEIMDHNIQNSFSSHHFISCCFSILSRFIFNVFRPKSEF